MDIETKLQLSQIEKQKYLERLIGRVLKILHLIEEEKESNFSPKSYIGGQLFEIHSANILFDNKLIDIIVKLNGVYETYNTAPYEIIRRQILEIKRGIVFLLEELKK